MSRITYTKKGNPSDRKDRTDDNGNFVLNSDGTVKTEKRTYTSYNFGKWVANKRNTNPSRDVWYKRTMIRGEYQFTPPSFTNTTMQMIRIPR